MTTPIPFRWSGEAMEPLKRFAATCDREFVIGELYLMAPVEERSEVSHRHEFAFLREAWSNLPEAIADQYANPEILRKKALIATGWCSVTDHVCGSHAEAVRWAANLRRELDAYTVVTVAKAVVRVFRARSQARNAMNREEFQASKTAILEYVSHLLDVTPDELQRQRPAA